MSNHPITASTDPWRILVLDPDLGDRKWIIATVEIPADVRPAGMDSTVDEMTCVWVAGQTGVHRPAFTRLRGALCWRIDEGHGSAHEH
jgi:hypothetical protein